jgi:hypothetical protein
MSSNSHWAAVLLALSALHGACIVSTDGRDPDEDAGTVETTTSATGASTSLGNVGGLTAHTEDLGAMPSGLPS